MVYANSEKLFLVKRNCDSLASFLKTDCPFLTPKALILPCAGKGVRRIFAIRFATCLIRLNFEARAVILRFFQYAFFCQNCQSSERKIQNFVRTCKTFRACLKNGFRKLRVPVCGRFCPNEGGVAGYGNRMRAKYTIKWGLQIAEMIFQTCSSIRRTVTIFLFCIFRTFILSHFPYFVHKNSILFIFVHL